MNTDSLEIINNNSGWISIVFSPSFDRNLLNNLGGQVTTVFGGAFQSAPTYAIPQLLTNNANLPHAISWYVGNNSAELNLMSPIALTTEAGKQIALAKKEGTLRAISVSAENNIDSRIRAKLLQGVVEGSAIEDLFPEFSWSDADKERDFEESALCLAAMFLKLQDLELAEACVDQAQSLNGESPRALTLKAMISKAYGETLGAVANLVNSLQQYEQQKAKGAAEGRTAASSLNIEVINYRLKEGLEALNQRNNDEALEKFASAVFAFDPFFERQGLSLDKLN
jgi:hypothetical protein